mmetsp:Transcript_14793/g.20035  ORF Transcript_14793/g.20035 Transcript_14793/m.20035 type:complete len:108 (+) Transcript_14793:589-912(+)|eukprot:CAMPEP_0185587620 /NCGR_PEP_ID=MMETSP0434-20130131/49913_1 /TAXON_ID=626734 ORGANISM="Favella taraikaensis, Strain Fe Narragansett Bay" /NCGR_SAMPLE_ID=MMETSP0434 /ASSEMBLY_ACC=CAM_ASM_000379 /LENGTH=107 /DNA_ID=CAMNT_0028209653 /DNA_START=570 /DNA_END=893 /DNA_ORIENTATION=-
MTLNQMALLDQKQAFVQSCQKLQQVSNRKYEALTSFLRDQNTESLFVDTLDSNTFHDMLRNERSFNGKNSMGSRAPALPDLVASDMALEDILDVQNLMDLDNYDYHN